MDITGAARDDIVLALIFANRVDEAVPFLNYFSDVASLPAPPSVPPSSSPPSSEHKYYQKLLHSQVSLIPLKGECALYLALNDGPRLKKFLSTPKEHQGIPPFYAPRFNQTLLPNTLDVHFGVQKRIQLLKNIVEQVAAEETHSPEEKKRIDTNLLTFVHSIGEKPTEEGEQEM